ncbi:MAG TPA: RagB/SusD family nutrient uptake outer membrane protein, partial [Chitinophagaceae bacterium]|nr:RagB/SusD family nutrient uptake outer membrane protein [Chitinophagaceae bacterium]
MKNIVKRYNEIKEKNDKNEILRARFSFSFLFFASFFLLALASCSKSYLEVSPKGQDLENTYYQNPEQAYAGLVAAYNPLAMEAGGTDNTYIDKLGALNSASDECYAGGGGATDMLTWQVWNNYTLSAATGPQGGFWGRNYIGIYRANLMLQKVPTVPGLSAALQARYTAECKFLRAYYYFELVRLFKNIIMPLEPITANETYNQVQVKPEVVYAQIEKDLKDAIPGLPATVPTTENGRVTKGAALALLGKAIIYQNNNSRMQEAAGYLEQVNTSPNYHLLTNFADIFSPDNKFNAESVFEIYHTGTQNAGWGNWPGFQGNVYTQMTGPRSYTGPTYWSGGWSFNPIMPAFAAAMKNDPRYKYTVANIDSIVTAAPGRSYIAGYMNTGFFINKYAPLAKYVSTTGQAELNFPNDYIEIRLADTYLLEAEALVRGGGDAAKAKFYLDAVRARVGLPSVPATTDNIYNERRFELATEGHRWFDLVRTGQATTVLASKGFK